MFKRIKKFINGCKTAEIFIFVKYDISYLIIQEYNIKIVN
jgi:hypothetical protein